MNGDAQTPQLPTLLAALGAPSASGVLCGRDSRCLRGTVFHHRIHRVLPGAVQPAANPSDRVLALLEKEPVKTHLLEALKEESAAFKARKIWPPSPSMWSLVLSSAFCRPPR